jgi:hypothetical protein
MGNFVQATDHDVHMYAKFGDCTFYVLLYINTPRFGLYGFSMIQ